MFDIGGLEFVLIALVGVMIIGPKELPNAIRTVTMWVRKARGLAREFQGGLDEMVREAELDDVKKELVGDFDALSIENQIKDTIDPDGEISDNFDGDWYSDHSGFDAPDDDDDDDNHDVEEIEEVAGVSPDDDEAGVPDPVDGKGAGSKA